MAFLRGTLFGGSFLSVTFLTCYAVKRIGRGFLCCVWEGLGAVGMTTFWLVWPWECSGSPPAPPTPAFGGSSEEGALFRAALICWVGEMLQMSLPLAVPSLWSRCGHGAMLCTSSLVKRQKSWDAAVLRSCSLGAQLQGWHTQGRVSFQPPLPAWGALPGFSLHIEENCFHTYFLSVR